MARRLKVCHDRSLPQNLNRPQVIESGRRGAPARAVFEFRKMWINGSNLRVRFIGGTASQRALAREQARWWRKSPLGSVVLPRSPRAGYGASYRVRA